MKARRLWLAFLLLVGCASGRAPDPDEPGIVDRGRSWVLYRGPELVAAVGYADPLRQVGDGWLILAAELSGVGSTTSVPREAISVRTPDGRRLELLPPADYRAGFGPRRLRVERALADLPRVLRLDEGQRPCDRWFLAGPFESFAYEVVYVGAFTACSGPLDFEVPGGIQPGRWRLVLELAESRADIPFTITSGG